MVTDDAPQGAEAEHLARLRKTGHPIMGVCNVKRNLNGETAERRFIRDSGQLFDPVRLEEIRRQFDDIAAVFNPDRDLPLVCSHLLGRFRANRMPDGERAPGSEGSQPVLGTGGRCGGGDSGERDIPAHPAATRTWPRRPRWRQAN